MRITVPTPAPEILIVDDEPGIRKALSLALTMAGFSTRLAANLDEAREALDTHPIQLLIVDLDLGHQDGFDLCRSVRSSKYSALPILVLSAMADYGVRVQGFELGIDDFVTKPFFKDELLGRVKAILRRCQNLAPTQRLNADACFDGFYLCEGQVRHQQMPSVDITPVEEKIMRCLMDAEGSLLRHQDLESSVWPESGVSKKTVDTHIASLRRKLKAHNLSIVSKFGIGYRLERGRPVSMPALPSQFQIQRHPEL